MIYIIYIATIINHYISITSMKHIFLASTIIISWHNRSYDHHYISINNDMIIIPNHSIILITWDMPNLSLVFSRETCQVSQETHGSQRPQEPARFDKSWRQQKNSWLLSQAYVHSIEMYSICKCIHVDHIRSLHMCQHLHDTYPYIYPYIYIQIYIHI